MAARRSLKKAFSLGSQQAVDREAVKKAFKQGEREACLFVTLKTTEMERVGLGHTCQPGLGFLSVSGGKCHFHRFNGFSYSCSNFELSLSVCMVAVAIRGSQLEEAAGELGDEGRSQEAVGLAEQLGDLYCKVGCYRKALDAYRTQVKTSHSLSPTPSPLPVSIFTSCFLTLNYLNHLPG